MYSPFLKSRQALCRTLCNRLNERYSYASILGKQITGDMVRVSTVSTSVGETFEKQCGFVARVFNGKTYSEYSFSDITEETIDTLEQQIIDSIEAQKIFYENHVALAPIEELAMAADFVRKTEGVHYTIPEIIEKLTDLRDKLSGMSDKLVQTMLRFERYEVSAMFLSGKRELTQNYGWTSVMAVAVAREGSNIKNARDLAATNSEEEAFAKLEAKLPALAKLAEDLLHAEPITPGVYEIITNPSITGLIAHEAFGHGVEMDMFVKERARSRHYIGKPVASSLVNMHDGAAAVLSNVGYAFDDDGVLAQDTLIIKEGILQTGISDAMSALQLGTKPTGNGRRQDPSRKAYTRMTNTFFEPGKDKLEDMIASVKYGYMLCQTNNGMEDPKNWNIQCVAEYGREIKDGKFTGKLVTPVVMSGYVPDLLMSISMVSDEWEVVGSGHCGKGYKEWVPVSDGGPYLKARCKLG